MAKHHISIVIILSFILSACGLSGIGISPSSDAEMTTNPNAQTTLPTRAQKIRALTVFAAASLTDAFQEIGKAFQAANPDVKVIYSFAGSQELRTQIEQGAVADIYACADHKNMDLLAAGNLIDSNSYQDFVTNRLVVILPSDNPAKLENLQDLAKPDMKLVLADSSVPAGNYARQILTNLSEDPAYGADFISTVLANVVSNETDVRQVVTKVELGEADAGIVYISDAVAAPALITISIPEKFNVIAQYPIAILTNSPNPDLAAEFVAYVNSTAGQAIMNRWGYTTED